MLSYSEFFLTAVCGSDVTYYLMEYSYIIDITTVSER